MRFIILCATLCGLCAAGETSVTMASFEKAQDVKVKVVKEEIKVKKGEVFSVKLESNPSTGYSWRMLSDTGPVALVKDRPEAKMPAAKDGPPVVGAPGVQTFEFKANDAGRQIALVFIYGRAWEGLGEQCFQLKVVVGE